MLSTSPSNIPENAIEGLKHNPNIVVIESDEIKTAELASEQRSWVTEYMGAYDAFANGYDGATTFSSNGFVNAVAVLDTGVNLHEDLVITNRYDFSPDGRQTTLDDVYPNGGHGTCVASIINMQYNNAKGYVGVAPGASVCSFRIFDYEGSQPYVQDSKLADAIDACSTMEVVNMSFYKVRTTIMEDALMGQHDYGGALFVAAAGNDNLSIDSNTLMFPQCMGDYVEVVSGTTQQDERYLASNYGPAIDLAAPAKWNPMATPDGSYTTYKVGTSFAAPAVAGLAALIADKYGWENNPNGIRDVLHNNCIDFGDPGKDIYYGYGFPIWP